MVTTLGRARLLARLCGPALLFVGAALCSSAPASAQGYGIRTWGDNTSGVAGIGIVGSYPAMPVRVKASPGGDGLSNVVQVANKSDHAVALKADGTVWCWGSNSSGQLGNGTTTDSYYPVQVMLSAGVPLTNATSVAAGNGFSLAVVGTTVYAWGDNTYGQLGNTALPTSVPSSAYPVLVSLPTTTDPGTVAVSCGTYTALALLTTTSGSGPTATTNYALYAWGDNSVGELGQGNTTSGGTTPVAVSLGSANPVSIAAGGLHCLAIDTDGNVWAWGDNTSEESGDPSAQYLMTPTQVAGIANVAQIAAGGESSFAVTAPGSQPATLYAWGDNGSGELGIGTIGSATNTPTEVVLTDSSAPVQMVAAGAYFAVVLLSDGTVWAAGDNQLSELGDGSFGVPNTIEAPVFQQVMNVPGATAVYAGDATGFVLTNDFKFVWMDDVTGIAPYWDFGNPSSIANTYQGFVAGFLNPDYRIVTALDLFQDGNRSLLLQSTTTGALGYLRLNGTNVVAAGMIPAAPTYSSSEVVVGTMNINNSLAIVWQNTTTGEVDYWTMGLQTIDGVVTPVSTGGGRIVAPGDYTWQVACAYPGAGSNWIIWHNISNGGEAGQLVYQQVGTDGNYVANAGSPYSYPIPVGWTLHVEDVNGDGNPDFIWHNNNSSSDPQSGMTYIWLMNGASPVFSSGMDIPGLAAGQDSIPIDYYIGAIL
jgi:alpha-tubulin suppressor-like RCC1 family protein